MRSVNQTAKLADKILPSPIILNVNELKDFRYRENQTK